MNAERATSGTGIPQWFVLLVAVAALVAATAALTATLVGRVSSPIPAGGMMGGAGMMGGYGSGGMMGGYGSGQGAGLANGPQPGDLAFVAGTQASPRVVRVVAGPGFTFSPSTIAVAPGETVTFQVTTMGPTVHEFMVGPAEAVAADEEGTPEIADIGMMATKSLTFSFDGPGPYAFACHVDGHYEAGMRGVITLVG
jgi:uncharacterized cupredoxin-like copper-binding protein